MSGLSEIGIWVEENYDFSGFEDVNDAYDTISKDFEINNRLPLDDILQEDKTNFIEILQNLINSSHYEAPTVDEPPQELTFGAIETLFNWLFG